MCDELSLNFYYKSNLEAKDENANNIEKGVEKFSHKKSRYLK